MKIRILVADDETLMRRLLSRQLSLESDFEVIGEAANGRQAVDLATKLHPDVVLMDLSMPLLNGAQATERIVSYFPHIKVIILTALKELAPVGKSSGAYEYLAKDCTPQELFDAIRRAHDSKGIMTLDDENIDHSGAVNRLASRAGLTEREEEVLDRVVNTELTIRQIATALSKEQKESVTESSVKHTLERVMTKMRVEPRTRAALVKRVLEFERGK